MATKTELEARVAELEAGRQKVVDEAMRLKRDQGYCDEVDRILARAGLEDLLPVRITVQVREASNGGWTQYAEYQRWSREELSWDDTPENREKALKKGKALRDASIKEDIDSHKQRCASIKNDHARALRRATSSQTLNFVVHANTDPEAIKAQVAKAVEEIKKPAPVTEPKMPKLHIYKYPQYRVVARKATSKSSEAEVLGVFDHMEVETKKA
jgi:hypothetical protein